MRHGTRQNQAESARRDLLLEEQQKAMRTALLKEYFSDPAFGDGELAECLDSPLREMHLPFHVLLLRFQETAPDVKKWGVILSRMADILQEVFEGSGSILVLRLHHDELLCLVAADAFPSNGGAQRKLHQIIRQISMHFSVSPSIFYSEPVTDAAQAKKKYELCRDAANLLFYADIDIVSAESIRFSPPADEQYSTSFMNTVSQAFHVGNLESLRLESHRYLSYCKNALILPQKVIDLFSRILDYVNFVNTFPEPPTDLGPEQQRLRASKSAHKLIPPRTPWHNGKVERSHRNDQRHFYDWEKFSSVDDLNTKLREHLRWSNRKTMRTLDRKSPLQLLREKLSAA